MSVEGNKALIRRVLDEAINQGNVDIIDELIASPCASQNGNGTVNEVGLQHIKQIIKMFRKAFPNLQVTVDEQIAKGDKVVTRWTLRGTHMDELLGLPPTGRQITVGGVAISRISAHKLVDYWGNFDALGLMEQLGMIPTLNHSLAEQWAKSM
jgi:predicted ester cyclase